MDDQTVTDDSAPAEPDDDSAGASPPPEAPPTPTRPPEPTVSDEEIDAFLLKPLSNPLDDGAEPAPSTPPPPTGAARPTPLRPPARPGAHAPKRLYRDPHGKIGGVASGLSHYFNVDVAIIRLILILLTLSFLPIPIYIAAWIAIPKAPTWPPPGPPQRTRNGRLDSRTLTAAAVLVGLIVIASAAGQGPGAVIVPVILVAVGVYLLNQPDRDAQAAAGVDGAELDPDLVASGNYSPYEPASVAPAPAWAYETTAPGAVTAPPRRRRRIWLLFLLPLIPIAMTAGGAIAVNAAQDTTVMLGEVSHRPQTVASINDEYSHSFGSVGIDFSAIDFTGENVDVEVKNSFGETYILVPDDVHVTVDVSNSFGEVALFGDSTDGSGDFERVPEDSSGRLHLELDNSFGEVRIETK